ncbi:MAG: rhombosortase [Cephaloticoccus sp.]|nr:rhombosortase [Cephaloticoccus sp.]
MQRGVWRRQIPWVFLMLAAAALLFQLNPAWRDRLVFDRSALEHGEFWRVWSGHWVHFGWPHFLADTGLFLILGWVLERRHPRMTLSALLLMPPFIVAAIYLFDPTMHRYAGLSALNLGLLLFLALRGWQRDWRDWFWPAVLVIYVGEVVFEIMAGGTGGGMIKFDDPAVRVATSAHVASAVYAGLAWALTRRWNFRPSGKSIPPA